MARAEFLDFEYRQRMVKDYFPDVPDKCMKCPALAAAAIKLSDLIKPANIEKHLDYSADIVPEVMLIAETFYSKCYLGAQYIDQSHNAEILKYKGMIICASRTPMAYFAPYLQADIVY